MKKLTTLALAMTLLLVPATNVSAQEDTAPQTEAAIQSMELGPMASSVVNKSYLTVGANSCTATFTFHQSTSGGITATLEKQSGSSWIEVASTYDSMSFAKSKNVNIPVSGLTSGKYRVSADIYAVIAGTEYYESVITPTYSY